MAWYYGTFACGCEGRTNVVGPMKNRQWIVNRNFEKLCPECYEKSLQEERERANAEALEKSKEMELPELEGMEKQVAWANTLRQKLIEYLTENEFCYDRSGRIRKKDDVYHPQKPFDTNEVLNYILTSKTKASWYIDSRHGNLHIEKIAEEMGKAKEEAEISIIEQPLKLEATVHPENEISPVAAEIKIIEGNAISVIFEKNSTFREVVKDLRYKWKDGDWQREIIETNGPIEDRAAELGNKLLNAGIPVCIMDEEIRKAAVEGSYQPEQKLWVNLRTWGDYNGTHFAVWMRDRNDRLYRAARSLPGSRWSSPSTIVRVEHWREVQEFAELYGFRFTRAAQEAIERQKELEKQAAIVDPAEPVEDISPKDGLKEILESGDEIIDDLKD